MKKVKIKKVPKVPKALYATGGYFTLPENGGGGGGSAGAGAGAGAAAGAGAGAAAGGTGNVNQNPLLQKNMMAYAPGALQTVGGLVDNLSESDDGTVSVGGKAVSGAFRGASTGLGIGAMFGPVGAAIGAGAGALIGGITQGINAGKQNQQMLEARKEEQKRERERTDMYSRAVLNVYPTTGVKDATYFAKGGRMLGATLKPKSYAVGGQMPPANPNAQMPPVEGGETEQLASGVHEVQGPTHEQGGVGIGQAEVEGGEVLQNTQEGVNVFSDRLEYDSGITFAQKAQELGEAKGKAEKALNEAEGIIAKNTAKRNIQKLDYELKRLFEMQESMKAEEGIENPEGMAAFGDTLVHALPYIDNLGNAIITAKTPQIPEPIYDEAVPLKTTFNINPQLEEINRQQSNLQRNLETNTANSGTLRNQMIASSAMATGIRNQLYGQKENTENQLINQDALNRQATINANILKENQTNMLKMQRVDDVHQRLSQNLGNAAEDAQMQIAEDNMRRKDELEYEILKAKYKETDVIGRNIQAAIDAYDKGDIDFAEFQRRLSVGAEARKEKRKNKEEGMDFDQDDIDYFNRTDPTWKERRDAYQQGKRSVKKGALGGTLRY